MSDTQILVSVALVLAAFILFVLAVSNLSARNAVGKSRAQFKEYEALKIDLGVQQDAAAKLWCHVHEPPREFIYTDVDNAMSAAHRNIAAEARDARNSLSAIQLIEAMRGGIIGFFDVEGIRKRIQIHQGNTQRLEELGGHVDNIKAEICTIHALVKAADALKHAVAADVSESQAEIAAQTKNVATMRSGISSRDRDAVLALLEPARRELNQAASLMAKAGPKDDFAFAVAKVLWQGVQARLRLVKLMRQVAGVNDLYNLDLSRAQVGLIARDIETTARSSGLQSYGELLQQSSRWEALSRPFEAAEMKFTAFLSAERIIRDKKDRLAKLDVAGMIRLAQSAEDAWGQFWGTSDDYPTQWGKLLNGQLRPTQQAEAVSGRLARLAENRLTSIDESKIVSLINQLDEVLSLASAATQMTTRFQAETKRHEDAAVAVERRLGVQGMLDQLYRDTAGLREKCSAAVRQAIDGIDADYKSICKRARLRIGVDFPATLLQLDELEKKLRQAFAEYHRENDEWTKKCAEAASTITALQSDVQNLTGRVSDDSVTHLSRQCATALEGFNRAAGYHDSLVSWRGQADTFIRGMRSELQRLGQEIQRIDGESQELRTRVLQDEARYLDRIKALKRTWAKPLNRHIQVIDEQMNDYGVLAANVDKLRRSPIETAQQQMDQFRGEFAGLNNFLTTKFMDADAEEADLDRAVNDLRAELSQVANRPGGIEIQTAAQNLLREAYEQSSPELAQSKIREAARMLAEPKLQVIGNETTVVVGDLNTQGDFIAGSKFRRDQSSPKR